jgi:hypothetical protein
MSLRDYYLPLSPDVFGSVVFLGIEAKMDGLGEARSHKHTSEGVPVWHLTVLTQRSDNIPEVELITLAADKPTADTLAGLPAMTLVVLDGLEGGKWTRSGNDTTTWSFRCSAVLPVKR